MRLIGKFFALNIDKIVIIYIPIYSMIMNFVFD